MVSNADFIEFDLHDPAALGEEYNFTDRAARHYLAGHRLLVRGHFEKAAELFARSGRSDPALYKATVARTETLILLGRVEEAAEVVDAGLNRYGRSAELGAARGHVFLHLDDVDRALECCDLATRLAPQSAYAWTISGEVRLSVEGADWAAEASFGTALSALDPWPYLELRIALACLEWGHLNAAANRLNHALQRDPDLPLGWILLGDVHRAAGRRSESRRAYRRAAELVPDLDSVRNALKLSSRLKDQFRRFTGRLGRLLGPPT